MQTERWKVCNRYPKYEVSDQGRVRLIRTGKIRKPVLRLQPGTNRPHRLTLKMQRSNAPDDRVVEFVHTLVLEAFTGPCPPGQETRHLDGDPTNNRWRNLAWGTHLENIDDSIRHGTFRLKEAPRWRKPATV